MKKNICQLVFLFICISSFSLKGQNWVSSIYVTNDCRTCISKTISTYDEELHNNATPAILMDNYGSPTLLTIDTLIINKTCMPISLKPIDIYRYKILPGNHFIIGCLRPRSDNSLNPYYTGPVKIYTSNQVYLEFNAEAGETYKLGAFEYRELSKWSLFVTNMADSILASSLDVEFDYVSRKLDSPVVSERISTVYKLDTLYKMGKDKKTLRTIASLLNDTSTEVRLHMLSVLSGIKNDTIPILLKKKYNDSKGDEKLLANSLLIITGNDGYDEALIDEGFKSQHQLVKKHTAKAVGVLGNSKYAGSLIRLLDDKNKDVRYEAAQSIGELGDASVIEDLKQFKKQEQDPGVKYRLNESIKKLKKLD